MKRSYIGLVLSALVTVAALLILPSCGYDRQLVAITVTPDNLQITGAGLVVNFTAIGTYIHPPEQRNITDSVVWTSSIPQAISIVSNTGVATSGNACGTNISIAATAYRDPQAQSGKVVVGTALVTVTQVPPCT
jgi:hypothetical protein